MHLVDGRLSFFTWFRENTPLFSALPWKARVNVLRAVNPQKAGEVSFSPSRQANSLLLLEQGKTYRLDALGITSSASSFFDLDNGAPPTSTLPIEPDTFTFEATATDPLVTFLHEHHSLPGGTSLTNLQTLTGAGSLAFSLNGGPYQDMAQTSTALLALSVTSQNRLRPRLIRTSNTLTRLQLTATYAS